jgi:hypothetical protein
MKKLNVRVHPKSGAASFFRCGTRFTQDWQEVEVDDATAARLTAEQMLEVALQESGNREQKSVVQAQVKTAETERPPETCIPKPEVAKPKKAAK